MNTIQSDKFREELEGLAQKYGQVVFCELGLSGPTYYVMDKVDMNILMLANWEPRARSH